MTTPSIGDLKQRGAVGLMAVCRKVECGHRRRMTFRTINMPDDAVFSAMIAKQLRLVCEACGSSDLVLAPDWADVTGAIVEDRNEGGARG